MQDEKRTSIAWKKNWIFTIQSTKNDCRCHSMLNFMFVGQWWNGTALSMNWSQNESLTVLVRLKSFDPEDEFFIDQTRWIVLLQCWALDGNEYLITFDRNSKKTFDLVTIRSCSNSIMMCCEHLELTSKKFSIGMLVTYCDPSSWVDRISRLWDEEKRLHWSMDVYSSLRKKNNKTTSPTKAHPFPGERKNDIGDNILSRSSRGR